MKIIYQFGFDLGFFVIWFRVSAWRFGEKVAPLILEQSQMSTISPVEIAGFFRTKDFILRDGWRLYRGFKQSEVY